MGHAGTVISTRRRRSEYWFMDFGNWHRQVYLEPKHKDLSIRRASEREFRICSGAYVLQGEHHEFDSHREQP